MRTSQKLFSTQGLYTLNWATVFCCTLNIQCYQLNRKPFSKLYIPSIWVPDTSHHGITCRCSRFYNMEPIPSSSSGSAHILVQIPIRFGCSVLAGCWMIRIPPIIIHYHQQIAILLINYELVVIIEMVQPEILFGGLAGLVLWFVSCWVVGCCLVVVGLFSYPCIYFYQLMLNLNQIMDKSPIHIKLQQSYIQIIKSQMQHRGQVKQKNQLK